MPFGALSAAQQILIRLQLLGGPKYRAELERSGVSTKRFAGYTDDLGKAMAKTTKRTFLHNQALFMARRVMFYATIAAGGMTAAIARMGTQYLSTMQQTSVALEPVFAGTANLNAQINDLFKLAAFTPFSFQQITEAFRLMYAGFQPLGVSVQTINDLLSSSIDIMSFMGTLTPTSLKRVSLALQDIANQGKLTGRSVQQLGMLGIPMRNILQTQLKLTGDQMERIGDLNIPVSRVLDAFIAYGKTQPGVAGAAAAQASETLFGAWSTFKDLLSQASGEAQKGVFGFIHQSLKNINLEIQETTKAGAPVTFNQLINAIDKELSPRSHLVRNLFVMMEAALKGFIGTIYVLVKAFQVVMAPFNAVLDLFGAGEHLATIVGVSIGVLTALLITGASAWMIYKTAAEAAAFALFLNKKNILALAKAQVLLDIVMGRQAAAGKMGQLLFGGKAMTTVPTKPPLMTDFQWQEQLQRKGLSTEVEITGGLFKKLGDTMGGFMAKGKAGGVRENLRLILYSFQEGGWKVGLQALRVGLIGAARAMWAFTVSLLANPITWIVIGVIALAAALVVLYRKWDWFHYKVNAGAEFIKKYWEYFVLGIPVIGQLAFVIIKIVQHFDLFRNVIKSVTDWIQKMIDKINIIPELPGWMTSLARKAIGYSTMDLVRDVGKVSGGAGKWLVTEDINKRAGGGGIFGTGPVLVGEQGPEVVNLPGGANVIPNSQIRNARVDPIGLGDRRGGGEDGKPIIVQVMLDRKVLAEGVARANQDYASRR